MMTDEEIIAVVQARAEGKKIQCKYNREPSARWWNVTSPNWDFSEYDFRVAPEPRKPNVLALVYKGNGTWKESLWEPHPLNEVTRYMEIIE